MPATPNGSSALDTAAADELPDDEWDDVDLDVDPEDKDPDTAEEALEPYFPNVEVFVREFLAPTYRRSLEGNHRVWCAEWWRHAEAINRLESLWRAWEHLRLEPATGMSVWLRNHADHHMAVLLEPDGTF